MNQNVQELTYGQGGSEWHFIRAGLGLITSSVASLFFRLAVNNYDENDQLLTDIINSLGINNKRNVLASIEIRNYTFAVDYDKIAIARCLFKARS